MMDRGSGIGWRSVAVVAIVLAGCVVMPARRGATAPGGPPSEGEPGGGGASGPLVVPDLVGMSFDDASARLRQAGFRYELEQSTPIDCATASPGEGLIRCQEPAPGARVAGSSMVHVTIDHRFRSHGVLTETELQTVVGLTLAQAKAKLAQLGNQDEIEIIEVHVDPATCRTDTICRAAKADGVQLSWNVP